ncbi:fumarylacetoacetate hydrolase family protein [Neisseria polysaccharea]|uniref:fumarylacetoacetate hydrolase family protein n=1 Tax=Neisseria polysaccharea TaxID=489 RepID=UPI00272D0040|nr:fumarylacetoacetate hydrolase family protein [Neisseria polysaccharea]
MASVFLEGEAVEVGNIFCIGRNYAAHIKELKNETPSEPVVFMKPSGSILNSGGTILLPEFSRDVQFECELVLLVGQDADGMGEGEDILGCVAGYGVGLDLTARDIQCRLKEKGLPWLKAKGFRHSACVSDFVAANKLSSQSFLFSLMQNGILKQRGNTEMMIYPLKMVLCELVLSYGLKKGDLVFTGTPSGVGKISEGDRLELELDGLAEAFFTVARK